MLDHHDLTRSATDWALALVGVASVTGTAGEANFGIMLRERIAALRAFSHAPEQVWTVSLGDRLGRVCVAALVRGSGAKTVVLTGHYDTVRVDDYGELAALAFDPPRLRDALIQRLTAGASGVAEERALRDLRSGAFLPGRGLLDMKGGLAAGLAVLEQFASDPHRSGNLLFLAVPDEEANSAGARCAAAALPDMARRFGLDIAAAINLDALVDDADGEAGRCVALGTVGKLLPSALVVGQPVHASNALEGVNAGVLAASIIDAVEWCATLTDRTGDERGPPPTLLGMKDGRTAYDVTTPDRIWAYWNVMTHRRGADAVLAEFKSICAASAREALDRLRRRAIDHGTGAGLPADVAVLTFAELRSEALARSPGALAGFQRLARDVADRGLDLPEQCRILTSDLWTASGRRGPAVVVGFASLPYLPTTLEGGSGGALETAVRQATAATTRRHGCPIDVIRVFPGISDMSFLGQASATALPVIAANTPAWGFGIEWPDDAGSAGIPIVNAGPWGRDYHTPLERVHTGYAFRVLPDLLVSITRALLATP